MKLKITEIEWEYGKKYFMSGEDCEKTMVVVGFDNLWYIDKSNNVNERVIRSHKNLATMTFEEVDEDLEELKRLLDIDVVGMTYEKLKKHNEIIKELMKYYEGKVIKDMNVYKLERYMLNTHRVIFKLLNKQ